MSWSTTVSAIATMLGTVTGITGGAGKVIAYKPLNERPDAWRTALKGAAKINAWTITRQAASIRQTGTGRRWVPGHDEAVVEGWYAATGDGSVSEPAFQALVDAVLAAFASSTTIWVRGLESEPITVRAVPINLEAIGGDLCHHVEIRFPVQDAATVT